jgi:hypothetical protein
VVVRVSPMVHTGRLTAGPAPTIIRLLPGPGARGPGKPVEPFMGRNGTLIARHKPFVLFPSPVF